MDCPICGQPMAPQLGTDGATPIGWECRATGDGVLSQVLPDRTTMDLSRVPEDVREYLGFNPAGVPLPEEALRAGHPRKNPANVAQAEAVRPD